MESLNLNSNAMTRRDVLRLSAGARAFLSVAGY